MLNPAEAVVRSEKNGSPIIIIWLQFSSSHHKWEWEQRQLSHFSTWAGRLRICFSQRTNVTKLVLYIDVSLVTMQKCHTGLLPSAEEKIDVTGWLRASVIVCLFKLHWCDIMSHFTTCLKSYHYLHTFPRWCLKAHVSKQEVLFT